MLCEKFKLNTRNKLLTTLSHFRSLKREGLTIVSAVKYPMNEGKLHGWYDLETLSDNCKR